MIIFRKMTPRELVRFLKHAVDVYASELLRFGEITTAERAQAQAEQAVYPLIPQGLATPGHHCYVLYKKEEAVGYFWYQISEDDNSAFVNYILIFDSHRRRGLARQTMLLYEAEVKSAGRQCSNLCVFKFNTPAVKLYEQMGYHVKEELTLYEANSVSRLLMEKAL